jgi:hypothetical protein
LPALFLLVIFEGRSHFTPLPGLFMLPWVAEITGTPPCPAIGWDGVAQTFYPSWPLTSIFPVSASQVAMITGLRHSTQLLNILTICSPTALQMSHLWYHEGSCHQHCSSHTV